MLLKLYPRRFLDIPVLFLIEDCHQADFVLGRPATCRICFRHLLIDQLLHRGLGLIRLEQRIRLLLLRVIARNS